MWVIYARVIAGCRRDQVTGAYWGRLHVYSGTRVTTHPCSEHVNISPHVWVDGKCGIGGGDFYSVVNEVELSCSPELS